VENEEEQGHLWTLRYPMEDDPNDAIMVATTRPETMLGDTAVAVHPDNPKAVAIASPAGVFESSDAGASFTRISDVQGTAVFFDLDGQHLWYGNYAGEARLARARTKGGAGAQLKLPPLTKDAVSFIAQNPARRNEYAIATFNRDVYLSRDAGRTWSAIARRGETK